MKNPLRKRLLRELRSDFGKYAVIFLLLVLSISEISGFLVAAESMIAAYDESFEKYNIEDGNFTAEEKMSPRRIRAAEELDISVYELFYSDQTAAGGQTVRIFKMREDINLACLMDGSFPEAENEIALDRMFADNNGLRSGDPIEIGGKRWLISGLVALSDYSTMFENNNDMMFDSKMFGVSVVTPEAFSQIPEEDLVWRYAWKYDAFPATTAEEIDVSDALAYDLNRIVPLTGFVPRYANQAIMFTGDDIGSDRAGMTMFLYIIIVIIAFVFTVTTSNTIVKEAVVIGTLRSMGYTKKELIRHFMTLPVIVSLAAALAGNVLGYTVLKKVNADLYYGSYSLPTYVTLWNASAFIETTVVPLALMLIINFLLLSVRLRYSPLQFLRRDLTRKKKSRAVRLPRFLPFFSRFRLRIFFQNISNYVLLFVGILFANTLLMCGLMFPDVL
ncbi:MAG: ABC transporter permease, partial [Lachnospiraceae bacterium]|nr:ABC transporter permease [Lachnospiraceae bacterium]